MDHIKKEPDSDDEISASAQYSEGKVIYIKQEYITEELPFSSDSPANDDPSELLQCKEEEMLPDEPEVAVKHENLLGFSDKSARGASPVEDSQPTPWRVCGSQDEEAISKERKKQKSSAVAYMQTYSCKMCNRKFTSHIILEKHQKSHSMYWCKDCNYEFCSRLNFQFPTGKNGTRFYVCELCNTTFTSAGKLRGHITNFHWRQKPYACDQCAYGSTSNDDQQTPYKCLDDPSELLQCKEEEMLPDEPEVAVKHENLLGFSDKSARGASPVEDSQPTPWRVCGSEDEEDISKERKKQKSSAVAYMHTYSCKMCNKKFTSRLTLEKHQKSHSVYWCKNCNYEFCSRLYLQLSAEKNGTPSYACELCNVNLTSAGKLRGHVTRSHWRQKPYACDQCADVTASDDVTAPNDDVQQMPYECFVCKNSFSSDAYLKQHLKHHSKDKAYFCNTCNTQCPTLAVFKSHLASHTEEKTAVALKTYKRKK